MNGWFMHNSNWKTGNDNIKFPIENLQEALSIANKIINNNEFKNNVIDLRVSNQLILSNE